MTEVETFKATELNFNKHTSTTVNTFTIDNQQTPIRSGEDGLKFLPQLWSNLDEKLN